MRSLGPRAVGISFFVLLVFVSASCFGLAVQAPQNQSSFSSPTLSVPSSGFRAQNLALAISSEPIWDYGSWERKKKKPPVGVPEGGSPVPYLGLTGLIFLAAVVLRQKQKSAQRPGC